MNVLFLCPKFHGYQDKIVQILKEQGHKTEYCDSNFGIGFSFADRAKEKINPKLLQKKYDKSFSSLLDREGNSKFDKVVVIYGGPYFHKKHVLGLKERFSEAEFVYFNWDSVENNQNAKEYYTLFDRYYSFDLGDCKEYGYSFLHDFYGEELEPNPNPKFDYGALMTFGYKKIKDYLRIKEALPESLKGKEYLVIGSRTSYLYRLIINHKDFKKVKKENIHFQFLSLEEAISFYNDCKAVIDVPLEGQHGLTTRTYETLKQEKKLITTNATIRNYDFYTPNNIFVVDDRHKNIPLDFFETPFDKTFSIGEKYSLRSFVNRLFGLNQATDKDAPLTH